jgi:hypothetical protein
MYTLTFSFFAAPNLTLTAVMTGSDGVEIGEVTVLDSFARANGWYGFTLNTPSGFRGFIEFKASDDTVAMFAVNPQEAENLDVKVSSVRTEPSADGILVPITLQSQGTPVVNAAVWVTTDPEGQNVVQGTKYTNDFGVAKFMLDEGTYYLWRQHPRFRFDNPRTIRVE